MRLELHAASLQRSMKLLDGTAAQAGRTTPVYPPIEGAEAQAQLLVRDTLHGAGDLIDPSRWQFAHDVDGKPARDYRYVWLEGGFQPAASTTCLSHEDLAVVGIGLPAVPQSGS